MSGRASPAEGGAGAGGGSVVVVLMGVAGSGKTTVGRLLAARSGATFYDADDFHPPPNVEKMRGGVPLTDADRRPWLESLRDLVRACLGRGGTAVLACSALREEYRDYLLFDERVRLVYLKGDFALIRERLEGRRGHFMRADLLASQFAALEEPRRGLRVDASAPPEEIVETIQNHLGLGRAGAEG